MLRRTISQREPPAAAGSTARTTWPARSPAEPRMVCLAAAASASSSARAWLTFTPAALRALSNCGVALGVPLLHALLANFVDLGARLAQAWRHTLPSVPRHRRSPSARLPWRLQSGRGAVFSVAVSGPCTRNWYAKTSTINSRAVGMAPTNMAPSCWMISCMVVRDSLRLSRVDFIGWNTTFVSGAAPQVNVVGAV